MPRTSQHRQTSKMESKEQNQEDYDSDSLDITEIDFEEDMKIDPDFLDVEFLNHAVKAMKYGKLAAQANKIAKEAEERVKTYRSLLVKRANEDSDTYLGKGVKPTAPVVEAFYRTDKTYKRIKQDWIDAVFEAELAQQASYAIQARKTVLENLVRLIGLEYNSTPLEPRDLPEAAALFKELKQKSVRNKVKSSLNKK